MIIKSHSPWQAPDGPVIPVAMPHKAVSEAEKFEMNEMRNDKTTFSIFTFWQSAVKNNPPECYILNAH